MRLIKVNSDAEQAVASRLGIQGIPTMIPSHEGREIAPRDEEPLVPVSRALQILRLCQSADKSRLAH